jgi:hypothetical protein
VKARKKTPPAAPAKPKRKRPLKSPLRNKQRAFLAAIAITGSIKQSAEDAKIGRTSHYKWMDCDPAYPARFAKAMAQGDDAYEDEVSLRAYKGVFEPLVFQGEFSYEKIPCLDPETGLQLTTTDPITGRTILRFDQGEILGVWKKSDALLMFRQRGRFPDRYGSNKVQLTGKNGAALIPTEIRVTFVDPVSTIPDSGTAVSAQGAMLVPPVALQNSARRTRIGEVLERRPRAADRGHKEARTHSVLS